MADSKLFNHIQSPPHYTSHIYFHQKSIILDYDLDEDILMPFIYAQTTYVKCCFIPRCLLCYFVINVYSVLFNKYVHCHLFISKESSRIGCLWRVIEHADRTVL